MQTIYKRFKTHKKTKTVEKACQFFKYKRNNKKILHTNAKRNKFIYSEVNVKQNLHRH